MVSGLGLVAAGQHKSCEGGEHTPPATLFKARSVQQLPSTPSATTRQRQPIPAGEFTPSSADLRVADAE